MRHPLLIIFFLITYALSLSAATNYPVGARSSAVANASVTYSDLWAAFNNQAGLAQLKNMSAGVYYENKFLLSDLSLRSFAFAVPVKKTGVFALSASVFGFSLYSEQKASIAYAKQL